MLHSAARQVAARYASLARDDIGQHATASLLQILGSREFYDRNSHAAFAISRMLKRCVFEWAEENAALCRSRHRSRTRWTGSRVRQPNPSNAARSSATFLTAATGADGSAPKT